MKRALHLFMPSLTGCLLVASLVSTCTGVYSPLAVPAADGPLPDTSGARPRRPFHVQIGTASWYGRAFQGRLTASGEIYDMHQPTAAHRTVPLGTQAVVTNLANGYAVRVRINDRGPHKPRRILDLSYEAARQLDMVHDGLAQVKVEFLEDTPPVAQLPVMSGGISPELCRITPQGQTHTMPPCMVQTPVSQGQRLALWVSHACIARVLVWPSGVYAAAET